MPSIFKRMRDHALAMGARQTRGTLIPRPAGRPDPAQTLKVLYKHDRAEEPRRGGTEKVHASSFVHAPKCSRMLCLTRLMRVSGVPFTERLMGSDRLLWKFGRIAEKHVRDALTTEPETRALCYGKWHCGPQCDKTFTIGHAPVNPETCDHCKQAADKYAEITFYDPKSGIIANPDLIMKQGDAYVIYEIKSIKGGKEGVAFDNQTAAQPKHVEQGAFYVRLAQIHGLTVYREPVILYVNKGYSFKEWYKAIVPTALQMDQAEAEVAAAFAMTKPYLVYLKMMGETAKGDWGDIPVPAKIAECAADMESKRKECAAWVECTAHG